MSTKFYTLNKKRDILEAKHSIKLLVDKNFHRHLTIYFQTFPKDGPVKVFVGKNVRHLTKISSPFADDVFTDNVTH